MCGGGYLPCSFPKEGQRIQGYMPTTDVSYYEFTYVSVALIGDFFPQKLYNIVAEESAEVGVSHVAFMY